MATPEQLDFSSHGGVDSDDNSPPSPSSLSRRKSPRKPVVKRATVSEEETKRDKKKKKKLASPVANRIWNEEDEIAILKGLVDYRAKTGLEPNIDWDTFFRFVQGSIHVKVSKEQLLSKIRKLKRKFLVNSQKINERKDPHFTRASDSEAFGYSMMIWGKDEDEFANVGIDKAQQSESGEDTFKEDDEDANAEPLAFREETFKEDEEDTNAEPLAENGAAKSDFEARSSHHQVVVDKITENGTAGKESHDDEEDELCTVRDAFETTMLQGLSDYQKKLQLEKLMKLGAGKRKELSDEWKALCVEESKLNIKKLRYSAKLAEAANDR